MTRRGGSRVRWLVLTVVTASATWLGWSVLPRASFGASSAAAVVTATATATIGKDVGRVTLVKPTLHGQQVGWFALDSGAQQTIVDVGVADRLDLTSLVSLTAQCDLPVTLRRAERLELGQLSIDRPILAALDFRELRSLLEPLDTPIVGILGHDIFARSVVEIRYDDVAGDQVAIYDPDTFELAAGDWQPLRIVDDRPQVQARFEGERSAWFMLDTGKTSGVSFYRFKLAGTPSADGHGEPLGRSAAGCSRHSPSSWTIAASGSPSYRARSDSNRHPAVDNFRIVAIERCALSIHDSPRSDWARV